MITSAQSLAERNMTATAIRDQHINRSRCCGATILGSAVRWCGQCGSTMPPADHETHAPLRGAR